MMFHSSAWKLFHGGAVVVSQLDGAFADRTKLCVRSGLVSRSIGSELPVKRERSHDLDSHVRFFKLQQLKFRSHSSVICCGLQDNNSSARKAELLDIGSPVILGSLENDGGVASQTHSFQDTPAITALESTDEVAANGAWIMEAEATIERAIFDFRFLTLLAVVGSLSGSLLCFMKGCVFVGESFVAYFTSCLQGQHTGKVVLRLVEAVDVYLVGTVMLIFGMGLYGLFISNVPVDIPTTSDRALQNSSLFGMFLLKKRPRWMRIGSLDVLKTKLGHVIVMILLVKMFEKSKTVIISTSTDLLCYSVSIFLSSFSLYVLHRLHE